LKERKNVECEKHTNILNKKSKIDTQKK
jgi:hypothetical protein